MQHRPQIAAAGIKCSLLRRRLLYWVNAHMTCQTQDTCKSQHTCLSQSHLRWVDTRKAARYGCGCNPPH